MKYLILTILCIAGIVFYTHYSEEKLLDDMESDMRYIRETRKERERLYVVDYERMKICEQKEKDFHDKIQIMYNHKYIYLSGIVLLVCCLIIFIFRMYDEFKIIMKKAPIPLDNNTVFIVYVSLTIAIIGLFCTVFK
jgi:hypothetical protein